MTTRTLWLWWSRWRADQCGAAAVEFALILPLMLVLYVGGAEISQAAATYRKVTDTTVELANIASQYTTMSAGDVSTVMNASSQIMAPYPTHSLLIVLSEITTDANSNATVTWSQPYNGAAALAPGTAVTLPSGLASPSTSYMLVQTQYAFVPVISGYIGTIPMANQMYILPRQSPSIPYTG